MALNEPSTEIRLTPAYTVCALVVRDREEALIFQERTTDGNSTYCMPTVAFAVNAREGEKIGLREMLTTARQKFTSDFGMDLENPLYLGHQDARGLGRTDFVAAWLPRDIRPTLNLDRYKKYVWLNLSQVPLTKMDKASGKFFSRGVIRQNFNLAGIAPLGQRFLEGTIHAHVEFVPAVVKDSIEIVAIEPVLSARTSQKSGVQAPAFVDPDVIDELQPPGLTNDSRPLHVLLDPFRK